MDRYAVSTMLCMYCKRIQPTAQRCTDCNALLGRIFCNICHFWDNHPNKSVYHCDKCGMCRQGSGLGVDYFHCDTCGVCLTINMENNHRCIERNLEHDCPICGEFLHTSTRKVIFTQCGHGLHQRCFVRYTQTGYTCPICQKSLGDMSAYFQRLDKIMMIERRNMPQEFSKCINLITCNDCEMRSWARYHFLYHRCEQCQGYNTRVISTADRASVPEADLPFLERERKEDAEWEERVRTMRASQQQSGQQSEMTEEQVLAAVAEDLLTSNGQDAAVEVEIDESDSSENSSDSEDQPESH